MPLRQPTRKCANRPGNTLIHQEINRPGNESLSKQKNAAKSFKWLNADKHNNLYSRNTTKTKMLQRHPPNSVVVKDCASRQEVLGSIPRTVKSDAASPIACHRCDVSSQMCCPGAKMRKRAPCSLNVLA